MRFDARAMKDWPNGAASRVVAVAPHRWHVQTLGSGADIVLIHGAGGSLHSWGALLPRLAESYRVTAIDLPGMGFSTLGDRSRAGLVPMAADLASLLKAEDIRPTALIGHSAGAAIALELARHARRPVGVVALNAALSNFPGMAGVLFPLFAKLLALNPATAPLFAMMSGTTERVRRLIASTGSDLSPEGIELYRKLISDSGHVSASLAMMAQWSLDPLLEALPDLDTRAIFLVGLKDSAVPPSASREAAAQMKNAEVIEVEGLGHLMHEEDPEMLAGLILSALKTVINTSEATAR